MTHQPGSDRLLFVYQQASYGPTEIGRIKAKRNAPHTVTAPHQQKLWFLGKGRYIINFLAYDRDEKELSQVQVFEFHPTKFRLTRRAMRRCRGESTTCATAPLVTASSAKVRAAGRS